MANATGAPIQYRMTGFKSAILMSIAVLAWAIAAFLSATGIFAIAAIFVGFIAGLLIPGVAKLMGVTFDAGAITTFFIQAAVGMTPFMDMFPAYVIGTAIVIVRSRREDRQRAGRAA